MKGRTGGSVLTLAGGVGLLWAGFAWGVPELSSALLPVRTLHVIGALALLVAGQWVCWQGAAQHVAPPESAGRAVDRAPPPPDPARPSPRDPRDR